MNSAGLAVMMSSAKSTAPQRPQIQFGHEIEIGLEGVWIQSQLRLSGVNKESKRKVCCPDIAS